MRSSHVSSNSSTHCPLQRSRRRRHKAYTKPATTRQTTPTCVYNSHFGRSIPFWLILVRFCRVLPCSPCQVWGRHLVFFVPPQAFKNETWALLVLLIKNPGSTQLSFPCKTGGGGGQQKIRALRMPERKNLYNAPGILTLNFVSPSKKKIRILLVGGWITQLKKYSSHNWVHLPQTFGVKPSILRYETLEAMGFSMINFQGW